MRFIRDRDVDDYVPSVYLKHNINNNHILKPRNVLFISLGCHRLRESSGHNVREKNKGRTEPKRGTIKHNSRGELKEKGGNPQ